MHTHAHIQSSCHQSVCVCVFFSRKLRLCSLLIIRPKALIIVSFYYVSFLSLKENDTHAISEAHGWINLFAQKQKNVGLLLLSHLFPQTTGVFAGLLFFLVVQGRDLETGGVGPLGNQKVV